jgi:hypothetical protein
LEEAEMDAIAIPLFAILDAGLTAVALVFVMTLVAGAALGLITWGLVLEARSNREWRERKLAL